MKAEETKHRIDQDAKMVAQPAGDSKTQIVGSMDSLDVASKYSVKEALP